MRDRYWHFYLEDIKLAMERILEYVSSMNFSEFKNDQKTIDAVVRNFEIMGEATRKIPDELKSRFSAFPWREMYIMRNKLSHDYFGIDLGILWDVIQNHLPGNYEVICQILDQIPPDQQ